jgi:hypothetical protein
MDASINEPQIAPATQSPGPAPAPERYIRLASWIIVAATLLFIPLKIISYGFLPAGDARRHVARAIANQPYTEIVVMRPEYTMDHSPGWEWLLHRLHVAAGLGTEGLVSFSIVALMLCLFFAPLPCLRRPEAWLAALLAQMVAIPGLMVRFSQARPYLLTEAILIAVLFAWSKSNATKPSRLKLAATTVAIAISVWMHGAWYLWALMLPPFFFARWWRSGLSLTACWLVGSFAGALLTGRPFEFLSQALLIVRSISREHVPQWMLVGELVPSYGELETLTLIAVVFIWRKLQSGSAPAWFSNPLGWMITLCWILGFKADRFWADWGIAAVLVWLTLQFQEIIEGGLPVGSPRALLACGLLAVPLFLHSTNDLDRRYTSSSSEYFLDAGDPDLKGWLPDKGGMFYCARLDFFYNTFYKNPQAGWRYILGFEPALMRENDLTLYRQLQATPWATHLYNAWIDKMHPGDRLVVPGGSPPNLPRLEWHDAGGGFWLGRLPTNGK